MLWINIKYSLVDVYSGIIGVNANYDLEEALMNSRFRFALDLREGSNTR
jgi:hypothetical protein